MPHDDTLPVPAPPDNWTLDDEEVDEPEAEHPAAADPEYHPQQSNEPHRITQGELNDLIRDLDLPKKSAELLRSRLQGWNLLAPGSVFQKCTWLVQPFQSRFFYWSMLR